MLIHISDLYVSKETIENIYYVLSIIKKKHNDKHILLTGCLSNNKYFAEVMLKHLCNYFDKKIILAITDDIAIPDDYINLYDGPINELNLAYAIYTYDFPVFNYNEECKYKRRTFHLAGSILQRIEHPDGIHSPGSLVQISQSDNFIKGYYVWDLTTKQSIFERSPLLYCWSQNEIKDPFIDKCIIVQVNDFLENVKHKEYFKKYYVSQQFDFNLISMRWKGLLSFANECSLDLSNDGILQIQGANAIGKSSILDLLIFLLYGRYRRSTAEYIRNLTVDEYEAELIFSLNNRRHKIIRWSKNHRAHAKLLVNDKIKFKGINKISNYIKDNFISYESALVSFIGTTERSYWSNITKGKRRDLLNKFLQHYDFTKIDSILSGGILRYKRDIKLLKQGIRKELNTKDLLKVIEDMRKINYTGTRLTKWTYSEIIEKKKLLNLHVSRVPYQVIKKPKNILLNADDYEKARSWLAKNKNIFDASDTFDWNINCKACKKNKIKKIKLSKAYKKKKELKQAVKYWEYQRAEEEDRRNKEILDIQAKRHEIINDELWHKLGGLDGFNVILDAGLRLGVNENISRNNKRIKKKIKKIKKRIDFNKELIDSLQEAKEKQCRYIFDYFFSRVNEILREIRAKLYLEYQYMDNDLLIFLQNDGRRLPISMCSGYQRFVIDLVIRWVLCEKFNLPLFIDEGFETADKKNFVYLLKWLLKQKNIWIISHVLDLPNGFLISEGTIARYEKKNE